MSKKADPEQIYQKLEARVAQEKDKVDPVYKELAAKISMGKEQMQRMLDNLANKELAAKVSMGESEYIQRILAKLANLEQAKILAALPDPDLQSSAGRTLEVSQKFADKLNMDKKVVDKHIRELFEKGLLFPTKKGPAMARSFFQLHDAALGNPKYDTSVGKGYFDLWALFEGPMLQPSQQDLKQNAEFRVIPRWKAIENVPGVMPYEDTRAILKAQDTIALLPCGCKRAHTDRWCDVPVESCIALGRTAQYNLDRGVGKKITYEQALEVLEKFDHYPTVNTSTNQKEINQLICNCHYCCCIAIRPVAKSRFQAETDPEKCKACRTCLGRCQFGATSMKYYPEYGGERAYIDPEICRGCGCCVITCPSKAKPFKLVRPPEHIPESMTIY